MSSALEQDVQVKYLLGELDQATKLEVEERYFTDDRYFEELVKLEKDLIGQDVETRIGSSTLSTTNQASLTRIERLPETEFAKQWLADVRELIATPDGEERLEEGVVAEGRADAALVGSLIDFYEAKLREADLAIKRQETESLLAAAWRDRELASALMEDGGLGLRLLITLKPGLQLKASSLAASAGSNVDVVAPVLIRLVQFRGIKEKGGLFSITNRGSDVIKNLETATASSL